MNAPRPTPASGRRWPDGYADDIEGHKTLLATAQTAIAEREPLAADTAAKAQAAKDRLARVEKGEAVAGIGAPMTAQDLLRITGMTSRGAALRARCRDRRGRRGLVAADDRRTATAQGEGRKGGGQAAAPSGDRGWPMSDLYDYATDVAAWAEQQAGLLRRRASGQLPNDAGLDWENLAEEIEGVAASQKREIRNRLKRICQHLLKWRHSTRPPSRSWRDTLDEQREQLDDLFKDSPSLRRFAADALPAAFVNGRRAAEREAGPLKLADDVCPWSLEQVLALDFFPDRLLAPAGILRKPQDSGPG